MNKLIQKKGKLLNEKGELENPGYSTSLIQEYSRNDIKANKLKIKEWDYYLIYNDSYAIALTIDDNSYMGMLSASVINLKEAKEIAEKNGFKDLSKFKKFGKVKSIFDVIKFIF